MPQIAKPLTLDDLPAPSSGEVGWPWTEQSEPVNDRMPDGSEYPRISIVTPSYNQGQFIEETIRSVLLQGYPNLEYIIIDGGSTDETLEIIKKYEPWLAYWESKPDSGPASAINKGIQKCTGEWFNWLNSDDLLLPKSLLTLVDIAKIVPTANWISGGRLDLTKDGQPAGFSIPWLTDPMMIAFDRVYLPQDATFMRLEFLREASIELSESLQNVFDRLFHFQLSKIETPLLTNVMFSMMRWHKAQRTANKNLRSQESLNYLEPYLQPDSLLKKLVFRLAKTRYDSTIRALIAFCLTLGFPASAKKWTCCCYVPVDYEFVVAPAHKWILSGK
ncbi:glycosyltransferase [Synechococcales cyanobacterium C]|uniref:Glycosyltransferase n=1 Tax=Petrachloros mirabilis ULC683 TaxID=2781853 RepID=A0A8K1ZYI8_9CYAN|nr:glycosyltransferase family 2 protein [Petrachloros mirabilis]NCJ07650.1 glycosyltransferase [Petrachloros mirabilis ULC683]